MPIGVIHIFTAVKLEASFIAKALQLRPQKDHWQSADGSVCLRAVGIRAVHLPANEVIRNARCLILAGFAGALDPTLKVGDVVLDECPQPWAEAFNGRRGRICASREIIETPEQKAALFSKTGALAVDMESDILRAWAAKTAIPFISIRAISDSADQSLDPALLRLIDSFGRPKVATLIVSLIRRPALMHNLLQLRAASNMAGRCLGNAAAQLVQRIGSAEQNSSHLPPSAHLSQRQT